MSVLTSFWQMLIILVLIAVGFICRKTGIVSDNNNKCISQLVINVFNPALIFSSLVGSRGSEVNIGIVFLVGALSFLFTIIVGTGLSVLMTRNRDEQKIYRLMVVFSNIGFIGIPVISAMFGTGALLYAAIFIFEYNVLIYTYGYMLVRKKDGKKKSFVKQLKPLINVGTVSCVIAIIIFATGIKLPYVADKALTYLGNAATPLSLMAIGVTLGGEKNMLKIFTNYKQYIFAFCKLILIPVAEIIILKRMPISAEFCQVCAVMSALPVGTMPLMLATENGMDGRMCSDSIILTTLLSVVTVPLIMMIYKFL
ncbi:MAG: AEC family transporter [Butyrivibrio sp.]